MEREGVRAAMAVAFVLVDAVPGMKDRVYTSLDKLLGKGLVAKEPVQAGNYDILVKVEAPDDDAIDDFIATHLRFISGVGGCRRISDAGSEALEVQTALKRLR